jgi:two-component system nitrogen regulation response regulator GlnG
VSHEAADHAPGHAPGLGADAGARPPRADARSAESLSAVPPIVLVVEDDPHVQDVLAAMAGELGYEARRAATAAEALVSVDAERPAVVLLDMMLPDATGTTTLESLRLRRPDLPVIMVTANTDEAVARGCLRRGAFDYVMKPFSMEHVERVLQAAIASAGSSP